VRPRDRLSVRAHRECDQRSGWRVSETLLSVQDLTKRFRLRRSLGEFVTRRPGDSALAVDHVSSISQGEILGLAVAREAQDDLGENVDSFG